MRLGDQRVVVEVKQFDPNPDESRAIAAKNRGQIVVMGTTPGQRIRQAIRKAGPQLREHSRGVLPTMLVIYNNIDMKLHTDPYAVATAMQGLDVVPVAVPRDPGDKPQFGPTRSGPKRMMTDEHNTTISAVAVLARDQSGRPTLDVYHSAHARNAIDPQWMRIPQVCHWRRPESARSSLVSWNRA